MTNRTVPELTLTMLGTTNSGKSMFLLGMYDTLSTGLHGYFTYTEDPDQGVDLAEAWEDLVEHGELPPPNDVNASKYYRLRFCHGFEPLVTIDWMDYRGGALHDRADSGADVQELRDRLVQSDSIYLVLDGGSLAKWLDGDLALKGLQKQLRVGPMTTQVHWAIEQRTSLGQPKPSLAVVITKTDLLVGEGRSVSHALKLIIEALPQLLPVVWVEGVTVLVCPVKVGDFGTEATDQVDVASIDPVGLHRPLVFSLMHYLAEGIGRREARIAQTSASQSEVDEKLIEINQGFFAIFRGRKSRDLRDESNSYARVLEEERANVMEERQIRGQLDEELDGYPIIRNGRLEERQ